MSFPKDTIIKQINMLSIKDLVTFNLEFIAVFKGKNLLDMKVITKMGNDTERG